MPPPAPVRRRETTTIVVRSLLATVETVGFATYVHAAAGGTVPACAPTLALATVVFAGAFALFSRHARLPAVATAVLGLQVVLHETFTAFSSAGHAHGGSQAMPGMDMAHLLGRPSASMLLDHVVIGIVTVLVLAWQNQALDSLAGLVRLVAVGPHQELRLTPVYSATPRLRTGSALLAVSPRRGPPEWVPLTP